MFWMPWRTHCLTDSDERAWAATTLPRHLASFTAMATSSSDIGVSSARVPVISSPERFSLIESTPYLISVRTVRRTSSGPDTTMPRFRPSCGMWDGAESPRPPTVVISGPAAV